MSRGRFAWLVILVAVCWCGVTLAVHRESPRTLLSAHGLLHAGVAQQYCGERPLEFPPENPFYAGEELPYYWVFQWCGAMVSRGLGVDLLHAFELLIVTSLAGLVVAGACLGRWLANSAAAGLAISFLILAGCNAHGPALLLARYVAHGPELFAENHSYLWGLVHPANQQMRLWDPWSMFGPLITFFLNVTARPLGLAGALVMVLCLERCLRQGGRGWLIGLFLATALCAAFSSVLGLALVGALGGVLSLARWSGRMDSGVRAPILAMVLGLVVASATFFHLLGRGGASLKDPARALAYLRALLAASGPLIVLAVLGWLSLRDSARQFCGILLAAAGVLVVAATGIALPVGNEDNWYHGALLLLSIPASVWLRSEVVSFRWVRRQPVRVGLLLLAFLPPLGVVLFSYTDRRPVALTASGGQLRSSLEPMEGLYRWLREKTAPDAVVVMDPRSQFRTSSGNTMELPACTGRVLWTEGRNHYLVLPYETRDLRGAMAEELPRGRPASPEEVAVLQALGREVWVVSEKRADGVLMEKLQLLYDSPAFENQVFAVYRWRPS